MIDKPRINDRALLLYAFLNYVKEKDINKPVIDIINNTQLMDEFVNWINQYASLQAGLEITDYVPIKRTDAQRILIKIFKKKGYQY